MSFEKEIIEAEFRTVSSSKTLKEIEALSNAILKLKRDTEALERQKKEAAAQFGANSKEVKELTAQIKANNAQISLNKSKLEEANSKLKITEMSTRQLRQRQAELKKAMESVNKEAFPDRWNTLNKAYKETTSQLTKVTEGSNSVKKGVSSIMQYAKGLLPAFGFSAITGGIISLSKDLFELSMRMKSDNIRNTTIFGDSLKYVESQAARLSKSMGLTNREFVSNAASSADLLKPLGFTSEEAARLSVKMQELAGPLAEWSKGKYNAAQITEVMNGALTGEMERLKGLGIIIQQSSPEYTNLVKEKQKEQNCTLEQAKALAALELMYQKSTDAQTAYAAGGNSLLRFWEGIKATVRGYKESFVEAFDETTEERLMKQQRLVNFLAVQLTNANTSENERVKILNQLQNINPRIVEGLNAESLSVEQLRKNLNQYNDEIARTIALESLNKEERSQQMKLADKQLKEASAKVTFGDAMMKLDQKVATDSNLKEDEKYKKILSNYSSEDIRFSTDATRYMTQNHRTGSMTDTRSDEQKNLGNMVIQYSTMNRLASERVEMEKEVESVTTRISRIKSALSGGTTKADGTDPEVPKSLLAVQQEKLKEAQKARDEATDTPALIARNKEIEAINTEISRLQALGMTNKEQASEKKKQAEELSRQAEERKKFQEEVLNSSLSEIEKENKTYEEKKKMAEGNGNVLEILARQHKDNLAKINADSVSKHMNDKKREQDIELQNMRITHNNELAGLKSLEDTKAMLADGMSVQELEKIQTLDQAKKEIKERQAKEEQEKLKEHLLKQVTMLQSILGEKDVEGLNLADNLLSDEQKKALEDKIRDLQEKVSAMNAAASNQPDSPDKPKPTESSNVDILGMTPDKWAQLFKNLDEGTFSLENLKDVANAVMEVWGMYDQVMTANENRQLKVYEKNTKEKKRILSQQLDQGVISQEQYNARTAELDAELDAKQSEIQAKQSKRKKAMAISQAIINTAIGVTSVYKEPFPLNLILATLIGSLGAAQIATIVAQPDGFKKGGFTSTAPSDDQEAGVVHANEFVATADAVRNPQVLPVLQMIDQAQRNGTIRTLDLSAAARQTGFRTGGFTAETPAANNTIMLQPSPASSDPEMKQLLIEILATARQVRDKDLSIPWYGRGGIDEKMKKAQKYEQNLTY